jgi:hypothetical protein
MHLFTLVVFQSYSRLPESHKYRFSKSEGINNLVADFKTLAQLGKAEVLFKPALKLDASHAKTHYNT